MAELSAGTAGLGRQFASFVLVGSVGFLVDAGLFLALHDAASWSIGASRAVSISLAVAATWILNRRHTFGDRRSANPLGELVRYAFVQAGGLSINLGLFAVSLWAVPPLRNVPLVPLILGSTAALLFNFAAARAFAFRSD